MSSSHVKGTIFLERNYQPSLLLLRISPEVAGTNPSQLVELGLEVASLLGHDAKLAADEESPGSCLFSVLIGFRRSLSKVG